MKLLQNANTPEVCGNAKRTFGQIPGYRDSEAKQRECDEKAAWIKYDHGLSMLRNASTPQDCAKAKAIFIEMSGNLIKIVATLRYYKTEVPCLFGHVTNSLM